MPAETPWKAEAVLRLILSVFACYLLGSVAASVVHVARAGRSFNPWLALAAAGAILCLAATLWLLRRDWAVEHLSRRLLALLVCFYGGIFLGAWTQKLAGPTGMTALYAVMAALSLQGGALVLTSLFLREHRLSWQEAFGLARNVPFVVILGVAAGLTYVPVGWSLQIVSAEFIKGFPQLQLQPELQQSVQVLRVAESWADRAAMGLVTILLAPVAEEILFRGILYTWIRQLGFRRAAFWGTAVLFALVHFNALTFLPVFGLALLLTFVYERTQNLLAPILAHALFNAMNFVALFVLQRNDIGP